MFTKTTITLLGLLVVCEVCALIVFGYQRTVRKLAMRLIVLARVNVSISRRHSALPSCEIAA